MPFAEWLYRMADANVPYQARSLAVYAVLFKVTANEDLARLSGMDTKGLADKTYNKWKRFLSDNGWVIIKAVTIGRQTSIEIFPAIQTSPVTFTDAIPRDPARFGQNKNYEPEVKVTGSNYEPAVEITDEAVKVTVGEVKTTDEVPRAKDIKNNKLYNNNNILYNNSNTNTEAARDVIPETKEDYEVLTNTLLEACNGSLVDPVNCQGLLNLSTPLMWLREGCDLNADIIPALRGMGRAAHGRRITTWNYFTNGIRKARDTRICGLPPPAPVTSGKSRGAKHVPRPDGKSFMEMTNETLAKIERGEL